MNEIELGDWARILRGAAPWEFVAEGVMRLLIMYLLLLLALRLMGRRVSAHVSRNEMLAVVSLAAAVNPAILSPMNGLLPPLIIAAWVVFMQRTLSFATVHSSRFEKALEGEVSTLVRDGRIDLLELRRCSISSGRLQARLRSLGFINLGQVQRCFFEPSGTFSVVRSREERPGMSLLPGWDTELLAKQRPVEGLLACTACGATSSAQSLDPCSACGAQGPRQAAVCGRDE